MDKERKLKFVEILNRMEGEGYLKSIVAFGAAPTIEGRKPSSLMTFNSQGKNLLSLWDSYRLQICDSYGLESFELKRGKGSAAVLLYRKRQLERYVNSERNRLFMEGMGYKHIEGLEEKLQLLKKRFEKMCPHEVGIFLGIPVEDVEGFIKHKGKGCIMCRYWKVYTNPRRAQLIFNAYDKARLVMVDAVVDLHREVMPACV